MATVSPSELAAYMGIVQADIITESQKISAGVVCTFPMPTFTSGFNALKAKAEQKEIIELAVIFAEWFSADRSSLRDGPAYLVEGYSAALSAIVGHIDNTAVIATDKAIGTITDNIKNTAAANSATEKVVAKIGVMFEKEVPWAVKLLDIVIVTGLQAVPFVGTQLSSVAKNGIASTVTGFASDSIGAQAGKLLSSDENFKQAQKDGAFDQYLSDGNSKSSAKIGEKTTTTIKVKQSDGTTKEVVVNNDLGGKALKSGVTEIGKSVMTSVNKEIESISSGKLFKDTWYKKGLNASFVYSLIDAKISEGRVNETKALAGDKEWMEYFVNKDCNTYFNRVQNPVSQNQILADFSNRGIRSAVTTAAGNDLVNEFKKSMLTSDATLKGFAKSISSKLESFRKFVDACVVANVALSMRPAIDEFKTIAKMRSLNSVQFGPLSPMADDVDRFDYKIAAHIWLTYALVKQLKEKPLVRRDIEKMDGLIGFFRILDRRSRLSEVRKNDWTKARSELEDAIAQKKLKPELDITSFQNKVSAIGSQRLSTYAEKAQKDGDLSNPALRMKQKIDYSDNLKFVWEDSKQVAAKQVTEIKRAILSDLNIVFGRAGSTGLEKALMAVLASTVIINDVHSQSARGEDVRVTYGAVEILSELGFVRLYEKVMGQAFQKQKDWALVKVSGETVTHRLRYPKDHKGGWKVFGAFTGHASIAETATLYAFASAVIANVDIALIATGMSTWEDQAKILNQIIDVINLRAIKLKNEEEKALSDAIKDAKQQYKDATPERTNALKRAEDLKKQKEKEEKDQKKVDTTKRGLLLDKYKKK